MLDGSRGVILTRRDLPIGESRKVSVFEPLSRQHKGINWWEYKYGEIKPSKPQDQGMRPRPERRPKCPFLVFECRPFCLKLWARGTEKRLDIFDWFFYCNTDAGHVFDTTFSQDNGAEVNDTELTLRG